MVVVFRFIAVAMKREYIVVVNHHGIMKAKRGPNHPYSNKNKYTVVIIIIEIKKAKLKFFMAQKKNVFNNQYSRST